MSLVEKLVAVSKEIGFLEFDATNDYHKYGYASAAGVIRKLNEALSSRGVLATSIEDVTHFAPPMAVVKCSVTFHDSDSEDTITCTGVGSGSDNGDKAVMKASTAAYKYAIAHALTLGWGAADPEGDSSTDSAAKGSSKPRKASKGGAGRGGRKPRRKAPEAILEALEKADGETNFTSIMKDIVKHRGTDEYARLQSAYKEAKERVSADKEDK